MCVYIPIQSILIQLISPSSVYPIQLISHRVFIPIQSLSIQCTSPPNLYPHLIHIPT